MRVLSALVWTLAHGVAVVLRALLRIVGFVLGGPLRLIGRLVLAIGRGLVRAWRGAGPWRRWVAVVVTASGALAVSLWVAAVAFAAFSNEYGFHPAADAQTWRQLSPAYATVAECTSCHQAEYKKLTSATHRSIECESCHGPLSDHAADATRAAAAKTPIRFTVVKPSDAVCQNCHVKAVGRPAGFRDIKISDHYLPVCLQCHDPHTAISRRPPVVRHTLENLPTCVTCHGADGFKKRDIWHPITDQSDGNCLLCHLPGRGPDASQVPSSPATGWVAWPLSITGWRG